jgi:hypothetical protein
MSIKQLIQLAGLELASSDTTLSPLLPADQPYMLSDRYRRNRIFRRLCQSHEGAHDADLSSGNAQPSKSKKDPMRSQSLHDSLPDVASGGLSKSKSRMGNETEGEDPKAPEEAIRVEVDALEYSPFPLKSNSSYSPSKLSERQLKRLDPVTRAKYEAYQKPNPEILNRVVESEVRVKSFLTEKRKQRKTAEEVAKKKWELLHGGHEDEKLKEVGVALAQKAKDRMHDKVQRIMTSRVSLILSVTTQ